MKYFIITVKVDFYNRPSIFKTLGWPCQFYPKMELIEFAFKSKQKGYKNTSLVHAPQQVSKSEYVHFFSTNKDENGKEKRR